MESGFFASAIWIFIINPSQELLLIATVADAVSNFKL